MTGRRRAKGGPARVVKLVGADVELGNFLVGSARAAGSDSLPARLLLREIDGVFAERRGWSGMPDHAFAGARVVPLSTWWNPQDVGRRFLPGCGGCAYEDLSHAELCVPETLSAFDHVAAWHALLRVARQAQAAANAALPPGERLQVLVNNSDGHSHSYGSHCNFLVTRRAWDNLFERKLHYGLVLAAFQASGIVYTGQGKVGSENGAPAVDYQLSQRADFFETLTGVQTTHRRPLLNTRDESLCGRGRTGLARLHVIAFDNTLCPVATLLKIGVMQIVLAMVECEDVDVGLILDDPLAAVRGWSHDPTLRARARLLAGGETTAVDLQRRFLDRAARFVAAGGCTGVVPRAEEILRLWDDTLARLARGEIERLAGRLDWVLKAQLLQRALRRRPGLHWRSPALRHLDCLYASLDEAEGLYWSCARDGMVEPVVDEARVAHFVDHPPEDTRAWTRAMLLRLAPREIVHVDWDEMHFALPGRDGAPRRLRLALADPLRFTRAEFERRCRGARTLSEVLAALGASEEASGPSSPARAVTVTVQ